MKRELHILSTPADRRNRQAPTRPARGDAALQPAIDAPQTHADIETWLRETDPDRLERLYRSADAVRARCVGEEVHLRGLVEFSNYCERLCLYCGLRAGNRELARYRMSADDILQCAAEAERYGYGTVVLQSGEEAGLDVDWLCAVVREIRKTTQLAITLSVGERSEEELLALRHAGADRYLLRFETSNRDLFDRIHPPHRRRRRDRLELLRSLRRFGYEVGSGVMIGIPGQTYADLASDIDLFRELDLDMIGVGPFIPHPQTPLGQHAGAFTAPADAQVPPDETMTYKTVALVRLLCPKANIPATTALATLNGEDGRELALQRGANVIMPNMTPVKYRASYEIYPNKACIAESAGHCHTCVQGRIRALGRRVGVGRGDSMNAIHRHRRPPAGPDA
jgi:biotin synthase